MGILMPDPQEQTQAQEPEEQAPAAAPQTQPEAQPQATGAPQSEFDKLLAKRQTAPQGQSEFDKLLAKHNAAATSEGQVTPPNQPSEDYGAEASFPQGEAGNRAAGTSVISGMAEQALGAVKSLPQVALGAPGIITEQLKDIPSQYRAYEAARQKGLPPAQAMEVVQQEIRKKGNAYDMLAQRVKELKSADSEVSARAIGKTIMDLLPIVLGVAEMVPESAAVEESTAARTAAATHRYNPATKSVEPIQQAAQKVAGKVAEKTGLPEGTPASVAPSPEQIQPALEQGIHEVSESAAKDSGVTYTKGADVRDAVGTTARATKASASADYKILDEASEGRWQRFDDKLENIKNEIDEKVGIDDEKVAQLESKRDDIMASQSNMLDDMVKEGKVDPNIADRARDTYKRSMAQHDINNDVRAATKRTIVDGKPTNVTDPDSLMNRLQKRNDVPPSGGPSRLQQALGEKGAKTMLEHVENAQIAKAAIKEFVPTSATGKVALQDMIQKRTTAGSGFAGPKIDHKALYNDFEQLEPAERSTMFGKDVPALRKALARNARIQTAKEWALKVGTLGTMGYTGYDIAHKIF
jgi:hypothetical protein